MFGFKKKIYAKQLRRASSVENCLLAGIFDHLMILNGYEMGRSEPDIQEGSIMAGAAHWIVGLSIEKQVEMFGDREIATKRISGIANELLENDEVLAKLVIRLLYEIASLSNMLKNDDWAKEYLDKHIRIMDILSVARPKWPELFRDVDESVFKMLFFDFVDRYMPDMKNTAEGLFL